MYSTCDMMMMMMPAGAGASTQAHGDGQVEPYDVLPWRTCVLNTQSIGSMNWSIDTERQTTVSQQQPTIGNQYPLTMAGGYGNTRSKTVYTTILYTGPRILRLTPLDRRSVRYLKFSPLMKFCTP